MEDRLFEALAVFVKDFVGVEFEEPLRETLGQKTLSELYFDSLSLMELGMRLEEQLGVDLDPALVKFRPDDTVITLVDSLGEKLTPR